MPLRKVNITCVSAPTEIVRYIVCPTCNKRFLWRGGGVAYILLMLFYRMWHALKHHTWATDEVRDKTRDISSPCGIATRYILLPSEKKLQLE